MHLGFTAVLTAGYRQTFVFMPQMTALSSLQVREKYISTLEARFAARLQCALLRVPPSRLDTWATVEALGTTLLAAVSSSPSPLDRLRAGAFASAFDRIRSAEAGFC